MEVIHDGRNHTTGPTKPAQGGRTRIAQASQSASSRLNQALNLHTAQCTPARRANKGRASPEAGSCGRRNEIGWRHRVDVPISGQGANEKIIYKFRATRWRRERAAFTGNVKDARFVLIGKWSPTAKRVAPSGTPVGRNPEHEPTAKAGALMSKGGVSLNKRDSRTQRRSRP